MKKLAIITTHPIQYNAPFFKLLTERGKVQLKVFYTWPQAIEGFDDPDFGKQVKWDIPLLDGYDWEGVTNISKQPSSKYWGGVDCPDLIPQIKSNDPDAILVYGWNLKSHFKVMRYFKGKKPVWFFGDSTLLDELLGIRKIARRLWLTWVYKYIDKAFYVGTNNKAYFKAHGLQENQLVFYPHVIDNDRFADSSERHYEVKAQEWRRELGINNEDLLLLFAGKFESKKNPIGLINAVIGFNSTSNISVKLLMVGNGPLELEMKRMVLGNQEIQFLPFQNQSLMPVVYRLGDIFCLPSLGPGETWGLAVNEAMACSRPVLASDKVGCAIDLIADGNNGYIFKSGTSEGLKEKISEFSFKKEDLKNMGIKAHEKIQGWNMTHKALSLEK